MFGSDGASGALKGEVRLGPASSPPYSPALPQIRVFGPEPAFRLHDSPCGTLPTTRTLPASPRNTKKQSPQGRGWVELLSESLNLDLNAPGLRPRRMCIFQMTLLLARQGREEP